MLVQSRLVHLSVDQLCCYPLANQWSCFTSYDPHLWSTTAVQSKSFDLVHRTRGTHKWRKSPGTTFSICYLSWLFLWAVSSVRVIGYQGVLIRVPVVAVPVCRVSGQIVSCCLDGCSRSSPVVWISTPSDVSVEQRSRLHVLLYVQIFTFTLHTECQQLYTCLDIHADVLLQWFQNTRLCGTQSNPAQLQNKNIIDIKSSPMHLYIAIFELVRPFSHEMMSWKVCDDISIGSGFIVFRDRETNTQTLLVERVVKSSQTKNQQQQQ